MRKPQTKEALIARYGEAWYENHKANCRERLREKYHADPDAARARRREKYARNPETDNAYGKAHREIYRINTRDRNRLMSKGVDLIGKEVHHIKYHKDKEDDSWCDDLIVMTRSEHRKWHKEHPEFKATENIV